MSEKFPSELRYDTASQDWVVIATGRAKRPDSFKDDTSEIERTPPEECPFCDIGDQKKPTLMINNGERLEVTDPYPSEWTTVSIPNLYPAFIPEGRATQEQEGDLYIKTNAVGHHEVVITKDHDKPLGLLNLDDATELIDVYYQRYTSLMEEEIVNYISIFQNHGPGAGASLYHPHSQLITTPLIDTDLQSALENSEEYYEKEGECVYCHMLEHELEDRRRIVFENDDFLVICPFASKVAFQMIVTPKKHSAYFHELKNKEGLAEAFIEALSRLHRALGNPSYNFYLHSAPVDGGEYPYYHWHWTILPKTAMPAGFELGVGMEISVIEPEKAAEYLREQ